MESRPLQEEIEERNPRFEMAEPLLERNTIFRLLSEEMYNSFSLSFRHLYEARDETHDFVLLPISIRGSDGGGIISRVLKNLRAEDLRLLAILPAVEGLFTSPASSCPAFFAPSPSTLALVRASGLKGGEHLPTHLYKCRDRFWFLAGTRRSFLPGILEFHVILHKYAEGSRTRELLANELFQISAGIRHHQLGGQEKASQ